MVENRDRILHFSPLVKLGEVRRNVWVKTSSSV